MSYALRHTIGYIVNYTLTLFIPVGLILLLSNEWYFLILKIISGLFIIGFFRYLLSYPASVQIGPAGPGFIVNSFLFGVWLVTPWDWMRIIVGILICSIFFTSYKMIKNVRDQYD